MNLRRGSPDLLSKGQFSPNIKGEAAMWIVALVLATFTGATLVSFLRVIWEAK